MRPLHSDIVKKDRMLLNEPVQRRIVVLCRILRNSYTPLQSAASATQHVKLYSSKMIILKTYLYFVTLLKVTCSACVSVIRVTITICNSVNLLLIKICRNKKNSAKLLEGCGNETLYNLLDSCVITLH